MTIFDKFMNPIWHETRILTGEQRLLFCNILTSYGALRSALDSHLLTPVEKILTSLPGQNTVRAWECLIDQAVVYLCRCCDRPAEAVDNVLPPSVVRTLPEIWGAFALADLYERKKSTYQPNYSPPITLEDCGGRLTIDEASRGLLHSWITEIKGDYIGKSSKSTNDAELLAKIKQTGFENEWHVCAKSIVNGLLKGMSRAAPTAILEAGKRESASVPYHRMADVKYMIQTIAKRE